MGSARAPLSFTQEVPIPYQSMLYTDGPTTYIHASSLSQCPNAFILEIQGHERRFPKAMSDAFEFGTNNEQMVLDKLTKKGYNINSEQLEIIFTITPSLKIVGHIDALASTFKATPRPRTLIEVKCLSAGNVEKFLHDDSRWTTFPYYANQVSAYWYGLEESDIPVEEIIFAIYNKGTKQLTEVVISAPPVSKSSLRRAVLDINGAVSRWRREDTILPCSNSSSFCPYFYLHDEINPVKVIDDKELSDNIAAYQDLKTQIGELETQQAAARTLITSRLSTLALTTGAVKADEKTLKFQLSVVKSKRLDVKRTSEFLKGQGKYDEFCTESESERLTISEG